MPKPSRFFVIMVILLLGLLALAVILRFMRQKAETSVLHPNVRAFIKMIRDCEGTGGPDGYRTVYGGGLINDLSDHPYITGEWRGAKLPDKYCIGAGLNPGCITTAAGAGQFTQGTWKRLKLMYRLKDFSPKSQDIAFVGLFIEKNALADIEAGRLPEAINKLAQVWASLPGSRSGQPQKKLAQAQIYFTNAGGTIA